MLMVIGAELCDSRAIWGHSNAWKDQMQAATHLGLSANVQKVQVNAGLFALHGALSETMTTTCKIGRAFS